MHLSFSIDLNPNTHGIFLSAFAEIREDSTDATVETLDLSDDRSIRNDELFELTIQPNPLTDATVSEELIVVTSLTVLHGGRSLWPFQR